MSVRSTLRFEVMSGTVRESCSSTGRLSGNRRRNGVVASGSGISEGGYSSCAGWIFMSATPSHSTLHFDIDTDSLLKRISHPGLVYHSSSWTGSPDRRIELREPLISNRHHSGNKSASKPSGTANTTPAHNDHTPFPYRGDIPALSFVTAASARQGRNDIHPHAHSFRYRILRR